MFFNIKNNCICLSDFNIYIENLCNGFVLYALLIAILSFFTKNFFYYFIGVLVLFVANIIRILIIVIITNNDFHLFTFIHNFISRLFIIGVFLLEIYIFKKLSV